MVPHHLESRIQDLLAAAHARPGKDTEGEYQKGFAEEGGRKAQYILDDLKRKERSGRLVAHRLIYLSVGGADGSEAERILLETDIKYAALVEVSDQAVKRAEFRAAKLAKHSGKVLQVLHGDVMARLPMISETIATWKREHNLSGIVCSAQAVLHELPSRSPGYDPSVLLGKIFQDPSWETVAFYSREPCKPHGWPDVVQVKIEGVSGESLRRFALHVAARLGLPQEAEDIANDWVHVSGLLAVELVHKLLRSDTISRINYELGEQLTSFDPHMLRKILEDHVPGIRVSVDYLTTEGFKQVIEDNNVSFRDRHHLPLTTPLTHTHIAAFRTKTDMGTTTDPARSEADLGATDRNNRGTTYSNLKAPLFTTYVQRASLQMEVMNALRDRSTPVLLTGMGGVGKTSLAHELAADCLQSKKEDMAFSGVVWLSEKASAGSTVLETLIDEIARTLDYTGLTQLGWVEKKQAVEQLLGTQKTLIVVDSFESVSDRELVEWLVALPEPSKALVTSRTRGEYFPANVREVRIVGLDPAETEKFVALHLSRLGLEPLLADPTLLAPLLQVTDGNPMAIEIALGLVKLRAKTLKEIVQDLQQARGEVSKLFDDLFSGAFALLDGHARITLLATHYFPYGTLGAHLKAVVDIPDGRFMDATDLLSELGLLNVGQAAVEDSPTYSTHPLVAAFIRARLAEDSVLSIRLRKRWLSHLQSVTDRIGLCWNDIGRLKVLDQDELRRTVLFAIQSSFDKKEYATTIALARNVRYYFYVRGLWSVDIHVLRAAAARAVDDQREEFAALTYHINIASKQRDFIEVEKYLPRLTALAGTLAPTGEALVAFRHALALYELAKGEYAEAEALWRENLGILEDLDLPHSYSANSRWFAQCLARQGHYESARELLSKALRQARDQRFVRGVVDILLSLAGLDVAEENFVSADDRLSQVRPLLEEVKDRLYNAQYGYIAGRLAHVQGEYATARSLYRTSADELERLGLRERADEIRLRLEDLMQNWEERQVVESEEGETTR